MINLLRHTVSRFLALGLLTSLAAATDLRVRVQGPTNPGMIEFGIHDDFIGLEPCGGSCFAPSLFQVHVPCDVSDSPLDVALKIAAAINADVMAQQEGFSATAGQHPSGGGLFGVIGPRNENYRGCVNFQLLNDQDGCCPPDSPTIGGSFSCVSESIAVPTMGEWGMVALGGLLLALGAARLRRLPGDSGRAPAPSSTGVQ